MRKIIISTLTLLVMSLSIFMVNMNYGDLNTVNAAGESVEIYMVEQNSQQATFADRAAFESASGAVTNGYAFIQVYGKSLTGSDFSLSSFQFKDIGGIGPLNNIIGFISAQAPTGSPWPATADLWKTGTFNSSLVAYVIDGTYWSNASISTSGTHLFTLVVSYTTGNAEQIFDFSATYDDAAYDVSGSVIQYAPSDFLFTPLEIGDAGADPSTDLDNLQITGYSGTTYYDSTVSASPALNEITISYADSRHPLVFTPDTTSATASVSYSGAGGTYDDGDVVAITVSDTGPISATYNITVNVTPASTEKDLATLTIDTGQMTPAFNPATTTYTVNLPYAQSDLTLTASVDPLDLSSLNTTSYDETFPVGTTVRTFVVTAEDGTTKTYTVNVVRAAASNDSTINELYVDGVLIEEDNGSFSTTILEADTNYNFKVLTTSTFSTIQYKLTSSGSYSALANNTNTPTFTINNGQTVSYDIRVTAQDGSYTDYVLSIQRSPSTDVALDKLDIIEGASTTTVSPSGGQYNYYLSNSGATQITVNPTVDALSSYVVQDASNAEVSGGIITLSSLPEGTSVFYIVVTAQDGITQQSYTLNVVKQSSAKDIISLEAQDRDNSYTAFTFPDDGTYSFNGTTNTYSYVFNYEYSHVRFVVESSPLSVITGTGFIKTSGDNIGYVDSTLSDSSQTITLTIEAEDGSTKQYSITFRKTPADSTKLLDTLEVDGVSVNGFSSTKFSGYDRIILPGSTTSVYVEGGFNDPQPPSTITYNGSSSSQITLTRGDVKTVNIVVTAQDGSTSTYTIEIVAANNNSVMSDITFNNIVYTYNPSTLTYNLTVPYTQSSTVISATPSDSYATVTGAGAKVLNEGLNTFTVYVTSEAGIKGDTYTFNITRSAARTDKFLETLAVGVHPLTPDFLSTTYAYSVRVDNDVTQVVVSGSVPDNGSSIVSGLGTYALTSGQTRTVNVVVEAEDGSQQTYAIDILRANDVNTFDSITLDGIEYIPSDFNASKELTLTNVPFSDAEIAVAINKTDDLSSLTTNPVLVSGNWMISEGVNVFTFYITSQAGTRGDTYKVYVTRNAANTVKNLASLEVLDGAVNLLTGDNVFNANTTNYSLRVDSDTLSIEIIAAVNPADRSTITGDTGTITLSFQTQVFTVTVHAEDGSTKNYNIEVVRANDNNTISDIVFTDHADVIYAPSTFNYDLGNVAYSTSSLDLSVILADSTADIYVKGTLVGQNSTVNLTQGSNTITIYAVSEFGTKGSTYTYTIVRNAAQTSAVLQDLKVLVSTTDQLVGDQSFGPNEFAYDLRVDHSVTSITINATLDPLIHAVIGPTSDTGSNPLVVGTNTFRVVVTAEDGVTKNTYLIEVTRANDEYGISDIVVNGGSIGYDTGTFVYNLDPVTFDVSSINIGVVLVDSQYATVNLSGVQTLSTGMNSFEIYATSEYGTKGSTYTINIEKLAASSENLLTDLELLVSGTDQLTGDNQFDPNKNTYSIRLDSSVTSATINATADPTNNSTISGTGVKTLTQTVQTFNVVVTAESGVENIYEITITRQNDNNVINNIEFNGYSSIIFQSTTTNYALGNVAYSTSSIDLTVTLADSTAELYVNGSVTNASSTVSLTEGLNTIIIYAVSEYGTEGTHYTYTITRNSAQTTAELSSLTVLANSVNQLTGDKAFDPATLTYLIRVNHSVTAVTINASTDPLIHATISPTSDTGNNPLVLGTNTFRVVVTAEDGVTKSTYLIEILRANDDNTITNITVNSQSISFNSTQTSYTLSPAPYTVSSIEIRVTTADSYAVVTGDGIKTLVPGTNTFTIYATSEAGTKGTTYTITVFKQIANTANYLSDLKLMVEGSDVLTGTQAFAYDKNNYEVRIDNNITQVEIIASVDPLDRSTITGTGVKILTTSDQTFNVVVTAENGVTNTYTLRVIRSNDINTINDIKFTGFESVVYNESQTNYALGNVSNSTTSLSLSITLADTSADIYVNGSLVGANSTVSLVEGSNIITIYAVSEYGTEGTHYTYTVSRNVAMTNAVLASLQVLADGSDLLIDDQAFNPANVSYHVRVDRSISSVMINATVDPLIHATFSGDTGSNPLVYGTNTFRVTVTAEDGVTKNTYLIEVVRANDNADITNITVNGQSISFSTGQSVYTLPAVTFNISSITIAATLADNYATLTGTGAKTLQTGANQFEVYATSEYGTQGTIYTINVEKYAANSDNLLNSLAVIAEGVDLLTGDDAFDSNTNVYNLRVDSDIVSITINASVDPLDRSTLNSSQLGTKTLISGTNNSFNVTVTAEDGTQNIYQINISSANNNYNITDIKVAGFATTVFDDSIYEYPLGNVPGSQNTLDFTITLEDSHATLRINGVAKPSSSSLTLVEGLNTFVVQVESEFGEFGPEYTYTVTRQAALSNADLLDLEVLAGGTDLLIGDQTFDPNSQSYVVRVDRAVSTIVINASVDPNNHSTISLTSDTGSQPLTIGVNTFDIYVTAEDGTTNKHYIIQVYRNNDNAGITDILINGIGIGFNQGVTSYQILPYQYNISSVEVTAVLEDSYATVSGTGTIALVDGIKTIQIYATSDYGTQGTIYSIELERIPAYTNTNLNSLLVYDDQGNPLSFNEGAYVITKTGYTIALPDASTVTGIDIQATLLDGTKQSISGETGIQTLTVNGDGTINDTFSFTVTAESGAQKSYSITVLKGTNYSTDASIGSAKLTDISNNQYLTFNVLNPIQTAVVVPYDVTFVTLNVVPNDQNATVIGNGSVNLTAGQTVTLTFYVVAQDGVTESQHYSVNVTRQAPSNDNSLAALEVFANGDDLLVDNNAFNTTKYTYTLKVDRSITVLEINAIASNSNAIITGDIGQVSIEPGIQTLRIFVRAEDGSQKTYTVNVEVINSDIEIISLSVDNYTIGFDPTVLSYDLGEVSSSVDTLTIRAAIPSNSFGTLEGTGIVNLVEGFNYFTVTATSEDETNSISYTIQVVKLAADANNFLSDLYVTDGTFRLAFDGAVFNKDLQTYQIVLDKTSQIDAVEIYATAENGSTPSGTGRFLLTEVAGVIQNDFDIVVTADNGDTRTYTITVVKQDSGDLNTDNHIYGVIISTAEADYDINFDDTKLVQNPIELSYTESSFYVDIQADERAIITGNDMYKLLPGETKTITFYVTSESGVQSDVYSIDVTRLLPDSDNMPVSLTVLVDGEEVQLDVSQTYHVIDVPDTIGTIGISAVTTDTQSIIGTGNKTITSDNQKFYVVVTAEDGTPNVYTIEVDRKSDDATLKSIMVNGVEQFGNFVNNILVLSDVMFDTEAISILATASQQDAVITGNGVHQLTVGTNVIEVYATSELGTQGLIYQIEITRYNASNDAALSALVVNDNQTGNELMYSPVFNPETLKYTIALTLTDSVSEILIDASARNPYIQSIDGEGIFTLQAASAQTTEIFTIKVVAEDGTVRNYEIHVTRQVDPNDDVTINSLSLYGDTVNYLGTNLNAETQFTMSSLTYNVTVPHSLTSVYLSVTNLNGAAVIGAGSYTLTDDVTTISFYLVSKSGNVVSDTYTVTITKEVASSNALLATLLVNGQLVTGFNPLTNTYNLEVSYETVSSIEIQATAQDQYATVSGQLGTVNLVAGTNIINVTVLAEDGTTNTYQLIVSRLSSDATLLDLSVLNQLMNYPFDTTRHTYYVNVVYTTTFVEIIGVTNQKAAVQGDGIKYLDVGDNVYEVYAVAEDGTTGQVYEVHVVREEVSTDSSLQGLTIRDAVSNDVIPYNPVFRPDTLDYIIILDDASTVDSLIIQGVANDLYASVGGNGYKVLKAETDGEYNNIFEVTVRAQDDSTTTYTVSVYRNVDLSDSTSMDSLLLVGSDGVNYLGTENAQMKFIPSTYTYDITVPFSVESMTLSIDTQTANAYGTGTKVFVDDEIIFTAYIVSQSGVNQTQDYVINIHRESAVEDNTLDTITLNGEEIDGFDPDVTYYEIDIPYLTMNDFLIDADANDPTSQVTGDLGNFELVEGTNLYTINVVAENGEVKTYTIKVNYLDANAYLSSLSVINSDTEETYPFTFNPETFVYTVDIGKNTASVIVAGQAQDQEDAAIIGLGRYTVSEHGSTAVIHVIASDNKTMLTYTINIIREELPSSNSRLSDLTVSGYPLTFNPDTTTYELSVGNNTSALDVQAIAEDENATVEIIGAERLDEGHNIITIKVSAEDGSQTYYQLSVDRDFGTDNFLTVLLIISLLVWIITILMILIKSTRDKKRKEEKLIR